MSKIPDPLEKLTFAISARLKVDSKKEKKQSNIKKKLTDYKNFWQELWTNLPYIVEELLRCWFSTLLEYIAFDTCR